MQSPSVVHANVPEEVTNDKDRRGRWGHVGGVFGIVMVTNNQK